MASIVKELDKVSGTTTRSHNIADAVSKLKMGGGSAAELIYIVEFGDISGSTATASKTRGEIMQALNENKIVLGFNKFGLGDNPMARQYGFVSFVTGVLFVQFASGSTFRNDSSEPDSSTSWTKQSYPSAH